jgi:hypothetical protein
MPKNRGSIIIDMVRRQLLISLLSLLFLNPYILAAENKTGHKSPLNLKTDILSRMKRLKASGLMIGDRKIGPGLNRLISRKAITGKSSTVLSPSDTANANNKIRIILETSRDLDPDTIKRYGGRIYIQT